MRTTWWDGDFSVAQAWGPTTYAAEPADPSSPTGHVHRGIDIMVPQGTPLHCPVDGARLAQIGYDPHGFGPRYPILHLADGTEILFGHTVDVMGSPRPLQRGEVFAHSGNEGMSTGPHVHAQVNASPGDYKHTKDPVPYLTIGGDDMTPEEHNMLVDNHNRLQNLESWIAADNPLVANTNTLVEWLQGDRAAVAGAPNANPKGYAATLVDLFQMVRDIHAGGNSGAAIPQDVQDAVKTIAAHLK